MMNANKAREITNKAMETERMKRRARAEEYCESLTNLITKACEARCGDIIVTDVPRDLYNDVIGICKENGYVVTTPSDKSIQLIW